MLPGSLVSDLSRASCALIKGLQTQKEEEEETQGGNSDEARALHAHQQRDSSAGTQPTGNHRPSSCPRRPLHHTMAMGQGGGGEDVLRG